MNDFDLLSVTLFLLFVVRLAASSSNPKAASQAAKTYFDDLNDMAVFAKKKDAGKVSAAYEKSKADLATFKTFLGK